MGQSKWIYPHIFLIVFLIKVSEHCATFCNICSFRNTCLNCLQGYFLQGNSCYQCSDHCLNCISLTSCLECNKEYNLNNQTCHQCQIGCLSCDSKGYCLQCISNYYLQSTQCIACPPFCSSCSNGGKCIKCNKGYYLNNNICIDCSLNCMECRNGEIFQNNQCILKNEEKYMKIILIVSIISIVFILFIICIIRCKKNNRKVSQKNKIRRNSQFSTTIAQISEQNFTNMDIAWKRRRKYDIDFFSQCAICLEKGVNSLTQCHHIFHISCISLWTHKNHSCPICRRKNINKIKIYCNSCHGFCVQLKLGINNEMNLVNHTYLCDFCKVI